MATRWYPIYQKGNPQLRVYLPNFWMMLVRSKYPLPENVVEFRCSMGMTRHDVKEYLTSIYNIPVVDVRTRIAIGRFKTATNRRYIIKDDDYKLAYVTLPEGEKFIFPDLFPSTAEEKEKSDHNKSFDQTKEEFRNFLNKNKDRPGLPNWFSI